VREPVVRGTRGRGKPRGKRVERDAPRRRGRCQDM